MLEQLLLCRQKINQIGEFMQPQRLDERFGANVRGHAEEIGERAIGQSNAASLVQQKQAFRHAIEERFLLGLDLERSLSLGFTRALELSLGSLPSAREPLAPAQVQRQQRGQRKDDDCQQGPQHAIRPNPKAQRSEGTTARGFASSNLAIFALKSVGIFSTTAPRQRN